MSSTLWELLDISMGIIGLWEFLHSCWFNDHFPRPQASQVWRCGARSPGQPASRRIRATAADGAAGQFVRETQRSGKVQGISMNDGVLMCFVHVLCTCAPEPIRWYLVTWMLASPWPMFLARRTTGFPPKNNVDSNVRQLQFYLENWVQMIPISYQTKIWYTYPSISFPQKVRGVDPPEMHAVSRKVRVPRTAHTPVRLCFEFLSYDFSVSNICLTLVF